MPKINKKRFVGKNGEFVPTIEPAEGTMHIGYLEELSEWLYFHENYTDEEKLKHILFCEKWIRDLLDKIVSPKCGYKPTWSPKLKKKIEKNKKKKK